MNFSSVTICQTVRLKVAFHACEWILNELPSQVTLNLWNFVANLIVKRTPFFLQNSRGDEGGDESHHPACITWPDQQSTRAADTWHAAMLKIHLMDLETSSTTAWCMHKMELKQLTFEESAVIDRRGQFLSRDAMLARYMQWSCVRLSVTRQSST